MISNSELKIKSYHSLSSLDERLNPRTPAEHAGTLAVWTVNQGQFSDAEIIEMSANPNWRTRTEQYRGHNFCSKCVQIIAKQYCSECGCPLPGLMPTLMDLVPAACETRTMLEQIASELLRTELRPKAILAFLHFTNQSTRDPLGLEDVDSIFGETAALELIRRRRGA